MCTCESYGTCIPCEPQRRAHSPVLPPQREPDKGILDLLLGGYASGWEEIFDDLEVDCA